MLDPGRDFGFFLIFQKCPKNAPQGPRGPGALFSAISPNFCPIFGPPWAPLGGPGGALGPPYFPYLGLLGDMEGFHS